MAKPENWNTLSILDKRAHARRLLNSSRGAYVIRQALEFSILAMSAEPCPQESNIEDMEIILEAGVVPVGFANPKDGRSGWSFR